MTRTPLERSHGESEQRDHSYNRQDERDGEDNVFAFIL
jgi:hypothetical protein